MHFREDDPHDPMHFGLPEELQRDPPAPRGGSLVTYVVVVVLVVGGLVLIAG